MIDSMHCSPCLRHARRWAGPLAVVVGCALLAGCTRPESVAASEAGSSARLDVAPLYSEAYQGRLPCLGCGEQPVDSEIVLYRERRTGAPAGYQLNQNYLTDAGEPVYTSQHGSWVVTQNGTRADDHPVYRLTPDDPEGAVVVVEQRDADTLMPVGAMARQLDEQPLERVAAPARGDLTITEADSGLPIAIRVGETLTVSLAAERGGRFAWYLVTPPEGALEPLGSPMRVAAGQIRQQVERDSTAVWQFRGRYPGEMALRFELRSPAASRPSSSTPPEAAPGRVVRYSVNIR
ncbi:protease inhibitor I42 family protein [Salinicola rhizosphaerae]|uniref:Proteinase inhibitor I42 chagasin domain-containing protein n=1 Tax=Salinicola rhizosphaerae TaxID=1443141 RepID=A0ABQ3DUK1_9GAMM|nr:protease inhibitor I42 family protein [Salinicola rhizosphaerae]GHB15871.1 hypothetical protein GCM10009038_12730 [Salinicola rhizosphaerae]